MFGLVMWRGSVCFCVGGERLKWLKLRCKLARRGILLSGKKAVKLTLASPRLLGLMKRAGLKWWLLAVDMAKHVGALILLTDHQ